MKKDLKYIFDESDDGELEAFLEKHPAADLSDKDLSSVKRRVYEKMGLKAAQSNGESPEKQKRKKWSPLLLRRTLAAAACLCLAVITVLTILPRLNSVTPPTPGEHIDLGFPGGSVTATSPKTYSELYATILGINKANDVSDDFVDVTPDKGESTGNTSGSAQIVDNQTAGIEEGDRVKRTGDLVFYLDRRNYSLSWVTSYSLRVYTLEGAESKLINTIYPSLMIEGGDRYNMSFEEIYLSEDGRTLALIAFLSAKSSYGPVSETAVVYLDVSDPMNIFHINTVKVSGICTDSRMVDGRLLMLTSFHAKDTPAEKTLPTYVPYVECGNTRTYISNENIYVPEDPNSTSYTVMALIESDGSRVIKNAAILSFVGGDAYVSENNIYITRGIFQKVEPVAFQLRASEIICIPLFEETFRLKGYVRVNGRIGRRYWMDEYDGILRVVTTTAFQIKATVTEDGATAYERSSSADLYCFDIETFEKRGEVIGFAPKDEGVQSVRFDKERAYVCTAIVRTLTDPVFFFDLSDLDNITYTDTGTIPGYSTSLIQFPNDKLVGIGVDSEKRTLKLEAYKEEGDKVVSIDIFAEGYYDNAESYKAYFIDRENGYLGIPVQTYPEIAEGMTLRYKDEYLLLRFDGKRFTLIAEVEVSDAYGARGFIADGYLYVLSPGEIDTVKLG